MVDLSGPEVERPLREAFAAGDFARTAQLTLELYGRSVLSFLVARLRSASEGEEAFAIFAEDLWRGLPCFGWRCTMRCWVYVLAKNAANRHAAAPERRPDRNLPLSQHASALVGESARSPTAPHRDSALQARVRALRERLSNEDQLLLILHVDRRLPFRELARVTIDDLDPLPETVTREAARLRKRFERLKEELRKLALTEGLIADPSRREGGDP